MTARLPALVACAGGMVVSAGPALACSYAPSPVASYFVTVPMFTVGVLLFWYLIKKARTLKAANTAQNTGLKIGLLCVFMLALLLVSISVASMFVRNFGASNPCSEWLEQSMPGVDGAGPIAPIEPLDSGSPVTGPIPLVP